MKYGTENTWIELDYSYNMKLFTDPVVIILIIMAPGIWILRGKRKEPVEKWGWRMMLCGFLFLYLLSVNSSVAFMAYALEKDYLVQDSGKITGIDVIVVPGGGLAGMGLRDRPAPSRESASRLLHGLQKLKESGAEYIVFTGSNRIFSDAGIMADAALSLGIDSSMIIVEPRSKNTWEHPVELQKVLKDTKMTLGIVTAASHMKRTLMVFKKYYPNIVPLPSSYIYKPGMRFSVHAFIPSTENFYHSSAILHEAFGLIWYSVKGYINK